jgi:hypothetical protein
MKSDRHTSLQDLAIDAYEKRICKNTQPDLRGFGFDFDSSCLALWGFALHAFTFTQ